MSPKVLIIAILAVAVLVMLLLKVRALQFERTLAARGWSPLSACPVREPWPGKNYGPIRCFRAEIKPGIPCVILVAQHLRAVTGNAGRSSSVDPYLGLYLPKEVRVRPEALAGFRARLEKAALTEDLEQVNLPAEGGLVLAWHSRPSIGYLDARLQEVAAALAD